MSHLSNKENKENFVRSMFNSIAGKYDIMNSLMSLGLDQLWRRKLVAQLGNVRGKHGLDICCGTGKLTEALLYAVGDNGTMTGIDFTENMLAIARQNISKKKKNIEFMQGNAMSIPFADNSFDFVTVAFGLRNVEVIATVIKEMMRVTKLKGVIISLDMAQPMQPLLKKIYWFLFGAVIPALGKVFARNKNAYSYLHDSVQVFPKQEELSQIFYDVGLRDIYYLNLLGGVVAIVRGEKP